MKKESKYRAIVPPNLGWLEYKLSDKEMDYVWRCIGNKKQDVARGGTYDLKDTGDWFWTNTILPTLLEYENQFGGKISNDVPTKCSHPLVLDRWWVNYQKQNQFNPDHNHSGIYSFVIWMKIPYDSKKEGLLHRFSDITVAISPAVNSVARCGNFQFKYTDTLGDSRPFTYALDESYEGTMVFFPAKLRHQVYPFYNCDEDRISVSGNITMNTSKITRSIFKDGLYSS